VDDRFDTGMRDALGADAARVLPLMRMQDFTFLVEDPATVWNLGPQRYPEISRRYQALTPRPDRLAVDINVVDRYQDVYPTKQQTGVELFELLHMASKAFSLVAVYFENSILSTDMKFLSAAGASVRSLERSGGKVSVDCPPGFGMRWEGPVSVDGAPWPVQNRETVWLPVGKHVVEPGSAEVPLRILSFNGTLLQAKWTGSAVEFEYQSDSRAAALLDQVPGGVRVDGKEALILTAADHTTLLLPRGRHNVVIQPPVRVHVDGVLQSSAVVP
jgi:hypothetical protein